MSAPALDAKLRAEYEGLWRTCQIKPEHQRAVDKLAVRIERNKDRYDQAVVGTAIPWWIVAAIHSLECGGRFDRHLHNGDPLTARTVHVPAGRPLGDPPFTWEASARDALREKGLHRVIHWDIAQALYRLEDYNGWGYHNRGVPSPYLWSFTNHYERGKFIADHVYSETAVSAQVGAAAIIRRLAERGAKIEGALQPPPIHFAREVVHGAYTLQVWLNEHRGAALRVDGIPGQRTSDAFRAAFGVYLLGDPRGPA